MRSTSAQASSGVTICKQQFVNAHWQILGRAIIAPQRDDTRHYFLLGN